jgi:hypothetical protein
LTNPSSQKFDASNYCLGALLATVLLLAIAGVTSIGIWVFLVLLWGGVGTAVFLGGRS